MRNSKRIKIVAGGTAVLMGGGIAFAYWTTTGDGTGTASTSAGASNLSFSQTVAQQSLGLYPGQAPQTIAGTVTNENASGGQYQYVTSVTAAIASVDKAEGADGVCGISDYEITDGTMAVGQNLAPGDSIAFTGAKIAFVNKATDQDGCKGATVNLTFTSN
jgi:hypothetical protein